MIVSNDCDCFKLIVIVSIPKDIKSRKFQPFKRFKTRFKTFLISKMTIKYFIEFACIGDRDTIDYVISGLLPALICRLPICFSSATWSLAPQNFYLNFDI